MEDITNDKVLWLEDRGPEAIIIDEDDEDWAIETDRKITRFGITPLAIIGVILNCVVIRAWTKIAPTFKPTFFLFKVLAVVDNVFVLSFVVWWYCDPNSLIGKLFYFLTVATLYIVVNVTLLVAISHYISLRFPFKLDILLSRFRVGLALGTVLIYCFVPATVLLILRFVFTVEKKRIKKIDVLCDQIFITLPIILQVGLSAHLMWMTFILSGRVSPNSSKSEMSTSYSRSSSQSFLSRRMTLTVVCITITAFVAYPVGISIINYFQITEIKEHASVKRVVLAFMNLLQIWNSSINFFFYVIYMPEFQETALACLHPVLKKITSSKPDQLTETRDLTASVLPAISQGTEQTAGTEDIPNSRGNEQHRTAEETPSSRGTKHHTRIDGSSKD